MPKISVAPASSRPPAPDPLTGSVVSGATSSAPGPALEVAHVLFMDVVGYSRLRMNQQAAVVIELQELVQKSAEVVKARAEGKLIVRPTGDGMALLFLRDLLAPVRCAIEISVLLSKESAAIKSRVGSSIALRMGIHSGSVLVVEDINAQSEVAGEGIITAQRVMDCGDAGHILLSSDVAERLIKIDPWSRYLKDLGVCQVKHGGSVHLFNLSGRFDGAPCGNSATPRRVAEDQAALAQAERERQATFFERFPVLRSGLIVLTVALLIGAGGWTLYTKVPSIQQVVHNILHGDAKSGESTKPSKPVKPFKSGKSAPKDVRAVSAPVPSPAASAGPSFAPSTAVPDMSGQTLTDARQSARDSGLRLRRSARSGYNSQVAQGTIYQQSPVAGATVPRGTVVYVRVSRGDAPDPTDKIQETDDKSPAEIPAEEGSNTTKGE